MKDAVLRLARHRLERAREALNDGQLLLGQGSLASAISRFCGADLLAFEQNSHGAFLAAA